MLEAGAWTLCLVLERTSVVDGTCVARAILFLPVGCVASLERLALCGVESVACRHGREGDRVEMVERSGTLWVSEPRSDARDGALEQEMESRRVVGIPG